EIDNARFSRLLPDHCIACHSSYPKPIEHLEGKYAEIRDGIGCERCHGPGALHVQERTSNTPVDSGFDHSIVNPSRMALDRRLDACEQCHVHTAVSVLREGKTAFDYMPSQPLRQQWAFFKAKRSIDLVSHADRLRQSKCFIATQRSAKPLECATCHDPHRAPADASARNASCAQCHTSSALATRLAASPARDNHVVGADCVRCHMPNVDDHQVHGAFTDHWIRVVRDNAARSVARRTDGFLVEPYYPRDSSGREGAIYRRMGSVVRATLSKRGRAMGDAADSLRVALDDDRTRGDAHFLLGVTYQQVGRTKDAISALEQTVRIDSTRPEALRALAQAYLFADRPAAQVERLYERALTLQPALAWVRAEYADFLASVWRSPEAEREYRTALAEEPSRAAAWFNLGALLAREGNINESTDAFKEAVHLDPSMAEALSPLVLVRTKGDAILDVKNWGAPLKSLPSRDRSPNAFAMTLAADNKVAFINVPPNALVLIFRSDGTLLCALPTGEGGVRRWDMLTSPTHPIGAGLFKALVQGRDAAGQLLPSQFVSFGIVRQRAE
ncbi:MAG: tetratricopeptide repeat protein, partial [Gemmatimonadaceae bacterium]